MNIAKLKSIARAACRAKGHRMSIFQEYVRVGSRVVPVARRSGVIGNRAAIARCLRCGLSANVNPHEGKMMTGAMFQDCPSA
jgi:hypothetical protein